MHFYRNILYHGVIHSFNKPLVGGFNFKLPHSIYVIASSYSMRSTDTSWRSSLSVTRDLIWIIPNIYILAKIIFEMITWLQISPFHFLKLIPFKYLSCRYSMIFPSVKLPKSSLYHNDSINSFLDLKLEQSIFILNFTLETSCFLLNHPNFNLPILFSLFFLFLLNHVLA